MMSQRIFIGLPADKELKSNIIRWQKNNLNPLLKMVLKRNLHLTIIPPWDEKNPKKIVALFKKARLNITPFNINLFKIEFGPDKTKPRLIWIRAKTPTHIFGLINKVNLVLPNKLQKQPVYFIPHITIARFNPKYASQLSGAKINKDIRWKFNISSMAIYRSKLNPYRASYKLLYKRKINH